MHARSRSLSLTCGLLASLAGAALAHAQPAQPAQPATTTPPATTPAPTTPTAPLKAPNLGTPAQPEPAKPATPEDRGPGPWDHDLVVYLTDAEGQMVPGPVLTASVAPAVYRDDRGLLVLIHQWYPDDQPANFGALVLRISEDRGKTWTAPRPLAIANYPADLARPEQPALVRLPDGRVRLYFAARRAGVKTDRLSIYSATSKDARSFIFDPGVRFSDPGNDVTSPAVTVFEGKLRLFAPKGPRVGRAYMATSVDGLRFDRQPDVDVGGKYRWSGAAVGRASELAFVGEVLTPGKTLDSCAGGLWIGTSTDGREWAVSQHIPFTGVDPAVVSDEAGQISLVVLTSPPRAGTPSEIRLRESREKAEREQKNLEDRLARLKSLGALPGTKDPEKKPDGSTSSTTTPSTTTPPKR